MTRTVASLVLSVFLAGCGFTERSGEFACETAIDCDDGRACVGGFCVTTGPIDAALPVIDADPDAPDAPDAPTDGGSAVDANPGQPDAAVPPGCNDGMCVAGENPTNCPADCSVCDPTCTDGVCEQVCAPGTTCNANCANDCTCTLDCTSVADCDVVCRDGTDCDIDCTNAARCDRVECRNGSRCLIDCTGATPCDFDRCMGGSGIQSCANDIIVCNRDCP